MNSGSLKIIVAALGSHGDVHPFIAIARELQSRGHEVVMVLPAMYETLVRLAGVSFVPAGTVEEFDQMSSRPELWHGQKAFWVISEGVGRSLPWYYDAILRLHDPGRTVLVMSSLVLGGRVAQEKLRVPGVTVHLSPAILRSFIDPPHTPPLPVSRRLPTGWNKFVYRACDALVMDRAMGAPVNAFRASVGLAPVKRLFNDWIHSPDRVIGMFPEWFAPPPADWPPQTLLTGFPLYDEADITPISGDLRSFLDRADAPIAFTPGSAMRHGQQFFQESIRVCQRLGKRGLFLTRYAEHLPPELPENIFHAPYAPFSRVFPHCAAVVHHGGIGTSAQAMAAGIPQLVVPMAHDQADNAARLKRLEVAESLPATRYRAVAASRRLRRLLAPERAGAYLGIKMKIAAEKPMARTGEIIASVIRGNQSHIQPVIR